MPAFLNTRENRASQRFPLDVPVRIKTPGSEQENIYVTRDVSSCGIFVYGDHPLPENSHIEFTMNLQAAESPEESVHVVCSGTVVRVESPRGGMAATIDSYRFVHQQSAKA